MARGFDSFASLFHTLFNRIVENSHDAFIFITQQSQSMANKLLATSEKTSARSRGARSKFLIPNVITFLSA